MKTRLNGTTMKVLQKSGELVETDELSTCTATWFVHPFAKAYNEAPVVGIDSHPVWTSLYCTERSIKKHGLGAIITASYEGAAYTWDSDEDNSSNTIEVSCSMREEPIEAHPDFKTWAGTASNPTAYAIWDDDGTFVGWNSVAFSSVSKNESLMGVSSYMVPTYTATVSSNSATVPVLTLGEVCTEKGLPELGNYREWMRTGVSFSTRTDGTYSVVINYTASSTTGWNRKVYPQSDFEDD